MFIWLRRKDESPAIHDWSEYRRRNLIVWLVFLGLLPVVALVSMVAKFFLSENDWYVMGPVMILYLLGLAGSQTWRLDLLCPRCKKPFLVKEDAPWYVFPSRSPEYCANCDQEIYARNNR